jgi:hypothetical protein
MFVSEYTHSRTYFDFEVTGGLPQEGILTGNEGKVRFKRIDDGIALYDSTLRTSGFVYPGSIDDIYVPGTINNIPVTELHQTIWLKSRRSFAIENKNLKRIYMEIGRKSLESQMKSSENGLGELLLYMLREEECLNQNNESIEVDFEIIGGGQQIEICEIKSNDKLVLHVPNVKIIKIVAPKVELKGEIPECVVQMLFSGKVYPYITSGWDGDEPNIRCFEGLKNLTLLEGSLSGDICWSFNNCSSLERVHLSNGIKVIQAYSFSDCTSLKDLYIPDTVSEIGDYAFAGCVNLASIHLPSGLKKISKGMFQNCKSLKKVYLADTIEIIEDYAFAGCDSLLKPWLPKNIKYIADTAFPGYT